MYCFVSEYFNILTWYPALVVIVDFQSVNGDVKEYFENMDTSTLLLVKCDWVDNWRRVKAAGDIISD